MTSVPKKCTFDGCDKRHEAKGLCVGHYTQIRQGAELSQLEERIPRPEFCMFDGCNRKTRAKELCPAHWSQKNLGQELRTIRDFRANCNFPSCTNKHATKGFCNAHYLQSRKSKKLVPARKKFEQGEWGVWCKIASGYVARSRTILGVTKRQYQHRHVMEEYLGRELLPHENVHHLNGIKDDNRIENLELWSRSQPYGQRVSDKIPWMVEFLESYGYKVNPPTE